MNLVNVEYKSNQVQERAAKKAYAEVNAADGATGKPHNW